MTRGVVYVVRELFQSATAFTPQKWRPDCSYYSSMIRWHQRSPHLYVGNSSFLISHQRNHIFQHDCCPNQHKKLRWIHTDLKFMGMKYVPLMIHKDSNLARCHIQWTIGFWSLLVLTKSARWLTENKRKVWCKSATYILSKLESCNDHLISILYRREPFGHLCRGILSVCMFGLTLPPAADCFRHEHGKVVVVQSRLCLFCSHPIDLDLVNETWIENIIS